MSSNRHTHLQLVQQHEDSAAYAESLRQSIDAGIASTGSRPARQAPPVESRYDREGRHALTLLAAVLAAVVVVAVIVGLGMAVAK